MISPDQDNFADTDIVLEDVDSELCAFTVAHAIIRMSTPVNTWTSVADLAADLNCSFVVNDGQDYEDIVVFE
jgi:hypothetical protein